MTKTLVLLAAALAFTAGASAQAQTAPAKDALVNRMIELQRPGYEALATNVLMEPALRMRQQAIAVLQRIPADRREALAKDLEADLRGYAESVRGMARDTVDKHAAATAAPLIGKTFTEDELKQVIAILESPVFRKLVGLDPEIGRALTVKVVEESKATIEPKVKALGDTMTQRVRAAAPAASAPR